MKLAFKNRFSFGYFEREVPIMINMGTLEAAGKQVGVEFWEIPEKVKDKSYDFILAILYQGYLTACKESFKKPKYNFSHAVVWYEYISQKSQVEFTGMMQEFIGKIKGPDKKKVTTEVSG